MISDCVKNLPLSTVFSELKTAEGTFKGIKVQGLDASQLDTVCKIFEKLSLFNVSADKTENFIILGYDKNPELLKKVIGCVESNLKRRQNKVKAVTGADNIERENQKELEDEILREALKINNEYFKTINLEILEDLDLVQKAIDHDIVIYRVAALNYIRPQINISPINFSRIVASLDRGAGAGAGAN